ncbi:hypothetical protein [Nocardia carnea]|uniref:hypothetical protein n=1 Tax=Nocardia carnea TaxID=37328 RepID=UPI0002E8A992|nr:hypothetical protein [Nocardia carnea]
MDLEIDAAAQDNPEWVVWSAEAHIANEIANLFTETLPTVPADWKNPAGDVVGPMPVGVDIYSDEMALDWVYDVFPYFFPDEDSVYDKVDLVNQFTCYIGDYFVKHCGGRWVNDPEAKVLHEFGPMICYDWTSEVDYPVNLLFDAAEAGFGAVATDWYSRTVDYAEAHGLPHPGVERRRNHG